MQGRGTAISSRTAIGALAVALSIGSLTSCSAMAPPAGVDPSCAPAQAADIVPDEGVLFGVNLDWEHQSVADYRKALGKAPAVVASFATVPLSDQDEENVLAAAEQVLGNGGSLLLTLEPVDGLETVTGEVADDIAALAARINDTGVPVVLRFAHEMNGTWYAWGQKPQAYVDTFRRVADAVHRDAEGTAMMWAPNNINGYPFAGGAYQALPGSPEYAALDTSEDGAITLADDPYAPYYPGDDAVDWVGMTLYHWGAAHPWGENEMPEPGKFAAQLTGEYNGTAGDDSAAPDFYQVYGVEHGKPVAIPETAALVTADADPATALQIKQAWWRQVFSEETRTRFPQIAMINWFEWDKFEPEVGVEIDWTALRESRTRSAFLADLPSWLRFGTRCSD